MYRNGYDAYFFNNLLEHHSLPQALWFSVTNILHVWWATRELSSKVMRERRELAELPDYILRDIGVDRAAASAESRRGRGDLPLDRVRELGD